MAPVQLQVKLARGIAVPGFYCVFSQFFAHQVAEGHRRPEGDPSAGVIAAHHARHVVADGEQARYRLLLPVQHPSVFVGLQSAEGAQRAGQNAHRVERPFAQRSERHLMVTLRAVIGRCAAVKIDVFTGAGEVIKAFNGFRQRIGIDGAKFRQLGQGVSSQQIAGTQPGGRGEREGPGVAQP